MQKQKSGNICLKAMALQDMKDDAGGSGRDFFVSQYTGVVVLIAWFLGKMEKASNGSDFSVRSWLQLFKKYY